MEFDWKKIGSEWLKPGVMSLLIPAAVSYYVSNRVDQISKTREAQSAQIAKFATGNDSIFVSATDFISSVSSANLTPPHDKLRRDIVQQIQSTDNLLLYFKDPIVEKDINAYKNMLDQSISTLDDASDAVKLVRWANALSKLNDAKIDLIKQLLSKTQISS